MCLPLKIQLFSQMHRITFKSNPRLFASSPFIPALTKNTQECGIFTWHDGFRKNPKKKEKEQHNYLQYFTIISNASISTYTRTPHTHHIQVLLFLCVCGAKKGKLPEMIKNNKYEDLTTNTLTHSFTHSTYTN